MALLKQERLLLNKMKGSYFTIVFFMAFSLSHAEQWDWAIQENIKKFTVDSAGNVFTYNDSTIKRFNFQGVFQWQKQFKGDLLICGMAADNSGNLYLAGDFTDFSIDSSQYISSGDRDIFFGKIDSLGNLLWYEIYGGSNSDNVADIYLTKQQKIIICGNVTSGAIIGSTLFDEAKFFTTKYDSNGNLELLIQHSGGAAWEVSSDTGGNTYLLGAINMNDTLDFGNGVVLYGYGLWGYGSHFIAKFNAGGNILWGQDLGSNYYQPFKNLAVDNNGNVYLTKWERYSGFDLQKFDVAGNPIWSHDVNGIYGNCNSVCIDNNDFIWLTGDIWYDPFHKLPFMWEFDPLNNLKTTVAATISASGNSIANDHNNNIYVCGTFEDTVVFGTTTLLASTGNCFLAKMKRSSGSIISTNNIAEHLNILSVFPNPSTGKFYLRNISRKDSEISIFDLFGRRIYHQYVDTPEDYQINLNTQNKGVYIIQVKNKEGKAVKKIIIQ